MTYLYRQPLLVTWRVIRVSVYRSVLVIVKCSVCSGNRIIGTHLRNSLLVSKISVKHRVLNQIQGLRTSLSAGHQGVCHPKPYSEWHQLHHQRLRALDRVSSSVLPLPRLNMAAHVFTVVSEGGSSASVCTMSLRISLGVMLFFYGHFTTNRASAVSMFRFVTLPFICVWAHKLKQNLH